jgi:hypothetical protein
MALPPTDVSASELFRKLQQAPRPSEVVDFPRKDGEGKAIAQVRIQVLTQEQHDEARERALHYLTKKRGISREDLSTELMRQEMADAAAKEVLALACLTVEPLPNTDPPRYGRQFPDGPSIGKTMTADEIGVMFTQYEIVQNRFGPYEGNINSEEELDAWIKRLAEGAGASFLAQLGLLELVGLTMSLARRSYTLSAILDRQFSSLPDTLKSDLESFSLGTGYFCGPPDESTTETGASSDRPEPGEPMTVEDAARIARRLHKHGS